MARNLSIVLGHTIELKSELNFPCIGVLELASYGVIVGYECRLFCRSEHRIGLNV